MKLFVCLMFVGVLCAVPVHAISDVQKSDPAYNAIEKSVEKGYLSLGSNDSFMSQTPVNRRELAVVIVKMMDELENSQSSMSKSDLQSLKQLSKIYQDYFVNYEAQLKKLDTKIDTLSGEQKSLDWEYDKINEVLKKEIQQLRKEKDEQFWQFWGGILVACILSLR